MSYDPFWFKDAIIYELHVRSFYDANGDGFGDFAGAREKLPYLQELGVTCIWLLPFYESPLRDDGYDIADYYKVLPVHGTLDDFKAFLDDAHARGMRVITELVLNHTSDRHPWFQEARKPGSPKRDWYVWSDTPEKYSETRIIFTDTEPSNWTWDKEAGAYFWHRFFSHQPDLNFDNPDVKKALLETVYYWLDMGVDGLRLDAVPYLYEREGTSCENLPETIEYIVELRQAIEQRYGPGRILLAEANQWPEDTLPYFAGGRGVQAAFNFPLMPRVYLGLRREDRRPIVEMIGLTRNIPEDAQWFNFLRNHDELTLEMVTDEERDFMYNEYGADPQFRINVGIRRRLAPLLGGERKRIELLNALLLSLPGTPVLYYGDEIGMGDNPFLGDRNGVRTPMQWSPDRNAGFSSAPHHRLFMPTINEGRYAYQFVNVEDEERDPHSLLNFMRRLLALRNQHAKVFGRGSLAILPVKNHKVFAYVREYEDQKILVVTNLSRFAQSARLELSAYRGLVPTELFGQSAFPVIGEQDYHVTLGPHSFLWFSLQKEAVAARSPAFRRPAELEPIRPMPPLHVSAGLEDLLVRTMAQSGAREEFEAILPEFLKAQRWFGAKEREITGAHVEDAVRVQAAPRPIYLATIRVTFADGEGLYLLPLSFAEGEEAQAILQERPAAGVAWASGSLGDGLLYDATADPGFWRVLLDRMCVSWKGRSLLGVYSAGLFAGTRAEPVESARPISGEQSNSAALLGDRWFAKLYRRLEEGPNPEVELLSYLTELGFKFIPQLAGTISLRCGPDQFALGVLQEALEAESDAWGYALQEMTRFFDRVQQLHLPEQPLPAPNAESVPGWLEDVAGEVIELTRVLGVRTAELHCALARATTPGLKPEPIEADEFARIAERMEREMEETRALLDRQSIPEGEEPTDAWWSYASARLGELAGQEGRWQKIRVHGDFHLGQVLRAGGEYYVLDFEGEPARPLQARRSKDQALRDVAGMLRSLEYAALVAWREHPSSRANAESETWAWTLARWCEWVFLNAYFATVGQADFLPPEELRLPVLWAYKLDKVLYEVRYELGHRPEWAWIPLKGLRHLLAG